MGSPHICHILCTPTISFNKEITSWLTTGKNEKKQTNKQKTCHCHKIYRVEAVVYPFMLKNHNYLPHTTFCFYLINFQVHGDFPYQFWIFNVKSSSVSQRSISQENAFKKKERKKTVAFLFCKTIASNNSFSFFYKFIFFLKITKF